MRRSGHLHVHTVVNCFKTVYVAVVIMSESVIAEAVPIFGKHEHTPKAKANAAYIGLQSTTI